jgi:hypothetical protein
MLLYFFYVVMYALFVLSVHVYYVNCNAKTQMGYLCALTLHLDLNLEGYQLIVLLKHSHCYMKTAS